MPPGVDIFLLPSDQGNGERLCVHHTPAGGQALGAVLYVHPWAEEMNKSRRMAALQARALAAAGYEVLQIDLYGCGDSSGDFADASWAHWVGDIVQAARWLQERLAAPLCIWGLRAGALLAVQAAAVLSEPCELLLWQPALSGRQLLQQFLRLKLAASMGQEGPKGSVENLRQELLLGRAVEVAGYVLPPALAAGLEQASLVVPANVGHIRWLEVSTRDSPTLLPASATCIEAWRAAGRDVSATAVTGPAFWQTQEIEDAPALLSATLAALREEAAA